ncbi:sensor histidine kinase [Agromyces humatus]|uniref:histidine kinase n=1 Tax=Agromyces humatus TaxID=279573 RepID=A0ABP4WI20_9MICO|nr:sensor histidine kinase [Agromyces humatus]
MSRSRWIVPVAGAVGFAVIGGAEIALDPAFQAAPLAPAIVLALIVTGTLTTIVSPIAGSLVVTALFPVGTALGLDGPTGVGVLAFFLLPGWAGYRSPPRRSWLAPLGAQLMATAGVALGAMAPDAADASLAAVVWENLFFASLAWVSWIVGIVARGARDRAVRAERLAQALDAEREAREHAILIEERQRIARDLHDAVAHSVSVMTLQVGAVRSTMPADAPQTEMLRGIERLGRESVAELRTAVGMLRRADEALPTAPPTLDRAAELVDDVRAAGLEVVLHESGDPVSLSRVADVSAYRVLQESLTNALRHAPGAAVEVRIARSPQSVVVEVRNGRPTAAAGGEPSTGGGHGLVGLRERLAMVGGAFEAGPTTDGGWRVRADFPNGGPHDR